MAEPVIRWHLIGVGLVGLVSAAVTIALAVTAVGMQAAVEEFYAANVGIQASDAEYQAMSNLSAVGFLLSGLVGPLVLATVVTGCLVLALLALRWRRGEA